MTPDTSTARVTLCPRLHSPGCSCPREVGLWLWTYKKQWRVPLHTAAATSELYRALDASPKLKAITESKWKGNRRSIGNRVPETVIPHHRSESRAEGKSKASLLDLRENYGGHPDGGWVHWDGSLRDSACLCPARKLTTDSFLESRKKKQTFS